ncbi:MAG: trypsin-like peptidase domain-containing protein [Bacillota bacterium]|nr:trypsin-like peptidase domain-containing protein [Bacillota bacterium]HHU30035.1 trypsin-like serine protease [Bacillota bacterium]
MDYFDRIGRKSDRLKTFLSALFGALVGGILMALLIFRFYLPDRGLDSLPNNYPPRTEQPEIEFKEQDLPEYQDTAIVRSAERVVPSVVGIVNKAIVYNMFYGSSVLQTQKTGSGVIIDSGGIIVTNNHVIDGADQIFVVLGEGEEYEAEVVGADSITDIAVLKIDKTNLPSASFGDSSKIVVGETVIAIGNPLGLNYSQTVTIGHISAKERSITLNQTVFNVIQTDAAINAGNSGGPLVNLKGEIIGINTAKVQQSGVEGIGFAIPSNEVKRITEELREKGRIVRPWLGIYSGINDNVSEMLAKQLNLPVDYGVIVQQVVKDGPADRAGMEQGDIIISFAGEKTDSFRRLQEAVRKRQVGDTVEIVVIRNRKEELKLTATLAEMPQDK